ncbi:COP9 signalosome complex subunit 7b isoform X2 [Onthophagus taurus]|uniref:COP9 signalosome complex subunit 7b isoform X2 n=1 Tax=Onthophagus taurus TaxID=166361 RepID=UPI000C20FD8F|nr:COP9 signalosome complex subunit 7b isoform X2 [Onthophagus taurus]
MVVEKNTHSSNPLEQFILLAKTAKGSACLELIKQVLEVPGIYVFGELLDMPNIKELESTPNKIYLNTLNLFAYGTYSEYLLNKANYLELTPSQQKKLQHLTIVTLATKSKCIPYTNLLKELDIKNVRDLEDLIIEAVYADIIHGKLDQKNSQLEVDSAIGRDIRAEDINVIVQCLQDWCSACEGVLSCVESQIHRANSEKNRNVQRKADIEQEIINIKKTLKTQLQERAEGSEEAMATDNREPSSSGEKAKKQSKVKGGIKLLR